MHMDHGHDHDHDARRVSRLTPEEDVVDDVEEDVVDDTVEVCEDPSKTFVVGVQWHPEVLADTRLFAAFVGACRR